MMLMETSHETRAQQPVIISDRCPAMVWISACALLLSMAWEIIPLAIIITGALFDANGLSSLATPFNYTIFAWVLLRAIACIVMAVGLLKKAEWAWTGAVTTVHGVFIPSLVVLATLYLLNITIPPTQQPDVKDAMTENLLLVMLPYGLTYFLLLFCLTRASVKNALHANE